MQQSFCDRCSDRIKEVLLDIKDITNVHLYPMDSLIVFNFVRANEISKALNALGDLGYQEEGEKVKNDCNGTCCSCRDIHV